MTTTGTTTGTTDSPSPTTGPPHPRWTVRPTPVPASLDDEDAWDIGAIAAFFALSNRMANMSGMMPNDEFYAMGRVPRS